MTNLVAWQIFNLLDKNQISRFGKFLESPYFNRRADVVFMFKIFAQSKKNEIAPPSPEQVFEKIFPGKAFDRQAFNYLTSYFSERLEQFLACEELLADRFQNRLLRCRAFRKLGLDRHFESNAHELLRDHQASPQRNAAWWLMEYQLQNEVFAHRVVQSRAFAGSGLPAATEALANFFLLENLRWSVTARSLQTLTREAQPPVPMSAAALDAARQVREDENPALALAHAGYLAQHDPDELAHFERLKTLIGQHSGLFSPAESRDFYMAAINFAIRRHNRGERHFTREAFDLYREALAKNVLQENGLLPKYTFINILNLAQLVGEHDWARLFLEEGRALLPPGERDNTYRYALAGYHFRRSEYAPVLELLREVEFSEVFIQSDARKMLLRSYYETGEWPALASLLDSFQAWLRRQNELGYHRESYLNLVKFTKKLLKTAGKRRAARRALAEKIREAGAVAEREWLLSKVS